MNRLILKYGPVITVVILAIFGWVIYQRFVNGTGILILLSAALVVWVPGAVAFILLWPRITVNGFRNAILKRGLGGGPIPVNTLYAEPATASESPRGLISTGTDDVLYVVGWLSLERGPLVLRLPDMAGRYYGLQFIDPATSANVAYVGTRTTGTASGEFLLDGPAGTQMEPDGMVRIVLPRTALVIGRVFVGGEEDRAAAYDLARQLVLRPAER